MTLVPLADLMPARIPSVDPQKFPNETFELWSIPAFDEGQPEIIDGSEIGSSKKCVEPGDVLLSRIVPHIRRAWVVGRKNCRRQIASGEWITFRSKRVFPGYLRHVLTSDPFHVQFMQTVAGVGGSLLRARPESVKEIEIPLPPLDEQKRISAILDQADELCRSRLHAIDRLNDLIQAIFYEMFGDPFDNPKGWKTSTLGTIVFSGDRINYGVVQPGDEVENGVPLIRVADLMSPVIDVHNVKGIDPLIEADYRRSRLNGDEILVGCVGSIGAIALATSELKGANIARAVGRVRVNPEIAERLFISEQLRTAKIQHYFKTETRTVAQPTLNIKQLIETPIILPPLKDQNEFSRLSQLVTQSKKDLAQHLLRLQALFSSLQQRAFSDEL